MNSKYLRLILYAIAMLSGTYLFRDTTLWVVLWILFFNAGVAYLESVVFVSKPNLIPSVGVPPMLRLMDDAEILNVYALSLDNATFMFYDSETHIPVHALTVLEKESQGRLVVADNFTLQCVEYARQMKEMQNGN